jgi:hypothetical protein
MHSTPAFFDRQEHVSVSVIAAYQLFLLSLLRPNDPEQSKGHTRLFVGPTFYFTLLAGSSTILRTIGLPENLAIHKRIHPTRVGCVMMIHCYCMVVVVVVAENTTKKQVLDMMSCDDISISGRQAYNSSAVAPIKAPPEKLSFSPFLFKSPFYQLVQTIK